MMFAAQVVQDLKKQNAAWTGPDARRGVSSPTWMEASPTIWNCLKIGIVLPFPSIPWFIMLCPIEKASCRIKK